MFGSLKGQNKSNRDSIVGVGTTGALINVRMIYENLLLLHHMVVCVTGADRRVRNIKPNVRVVKTAS